MGGSNPYLKEVEVSLPTKPYKILFKVKGEDERDVEVEVDPSKLPYTREGRPGSILDIALGAGIDLDHSCGGVCACSTCHVIVHQGLDSCNESTEDEEDQLDNARGLTTKSRLGCQCVPDGSTDVAVEIPAWNRNLVSEGH
ncbi:MAG: 2Fe-2S iron-sulfur cluster-binding protein [Nitrospinota bacterium]